MPADVATLYQRTRSAGKILVVDLGFLGDSVHLVPACWELRRHYPTAEIHTLSAVVGSEVLRLAPCVDRAWEYPLTKPSPPWWKHLDILRQLRRERFDVALSFSGADRPVMVTALSGARHRWVHNSGRSHFYNRWIIPEWIPRQPDTLPVFEQRLRILAAAGLTPGVPRWDLRVSQDDATRSLVAELGEPLIHLSLSSNTELNDWPVDHYVRLATSLLAGNPRVNLVVSGGGNPRDQERCAAFVAAVANPRLRRLPAGLNLGQLAAVLKSSRVHFGPDSGILHLATALGVPTVATFRQRPGWTQWIPPMPTHRTLSAACACCTGGPPVCSAAGQAACLAAIPVEAALSAITDLLGESPPSGTPH